jgi:dephospho-CoA kinase
MKNRSPAKLIGLTGGFGCGKSTVLEIFERLGAVTLSADVIVHYALKEARIRDSIVKSFGTDVLVEGEIDRRILSEKIFADQRARKKLEGLLHPYVFRFIEGEQKKHEGEIIIVEIPLLFETGYEREVDKVIAVCAREDRVNERLLRRGFSMDDIRMRRATQLPTEEKMAKADYEIDNSDSLEDTERQVKVIWRDL